MCSGKMQQARTRLPRMECLRSLPFVIRSRRWDLGVHIQTILWLRSQAVCGRRKYHEIFVRHPAKPFLSNPETFNVCFRTEEISTIYQIEWKHCITMLQTANNAYNTFVLLPFPAMRHFLWDYFNMHVFFFKQPTIIYSDHSLLRKTIKKVINKKLLNTIVLNLKWIQNEVNYLQKIYNFKYSVCVLEMVLN